MTKQSETTSFFHALSRSVARTDVLGRASSAIEINSRTPQALFISVNKATSSAFVQ